MRPERLEVASEEGDCEAPSLITLVVIQTTRRPSEPQFLSSTRVKEALAANNISPLSIFVSLHH